MALLVALVLLRISAAYADNVSDIVNGVTSGIAGISNGFGIPLQGSAQATYYGTGDGGACGYQSVVGSGYGPMIAAGSPLIYKNGLGCGACYRIQCVNSPACNGNSIVVPIVDLCPGGNWCCPTCVHFDLSQAAFNAIADPAAGHVDLQYERVPCGFQGPMRLTITGSPFWMNVLVRNVAGAGEVSSVEVQPAGSNAWLPMLHIWGANWAFAGFLQAPLSFRFKSGLDGNAVVTKEGCLPNGWSPGDYFCGQQLATSLEGEGTSGNAGGGDGGGSEGLSSGPPKLNNNGGGNSNNNNNGNSPAPGNSTGGNGTSNSQASGHLNNHMFRGRPGGHHKH